MVASACFTYSSSSPEDKWCSINLPRNENIVESLEVMNERDLVICWRADIYANIWIQMFVYVIVYKNIFKSI